MLFEQISKAEMIILSMSFFVLQKVKHLFGKKESHKIYYLYKMQQAVICGKAVFREDLLYAFIKFN